LQRKIWPIIEKLLFLQHKTANKIIMKSSELHRRFIKAGYKFDHAEGSHYFYIKDGVMTEPIPYHGAKEMGTGIANKLIRKYGI
jgi:predicted RNA binding protein YcfA (HicA-like mRNA interferase family)